MPPSHTYLPRTWLGSQFSSRLLPSTIAPLSAHLKLTEQCQAKCISCDYWKAPWHDAIGTNRAIELLNEITDIGIRSVRLTGGEPLLRKDLFQILSSANLRTLKQITLQTNGLLIKRLYREINASPITKVAVSVDGLRSSNDLIRGIRGYFDAAVQGIKLIKGKRLALSLTLNHLSAHELDEVADLASELGAEVETNILSRDLPFLKNADLQALWPKEHDIPAITAFLRERLKRPAYEVDYISRYYSGEQPIDPPCVLAYLQVFVVSNGDVLTGCYPLRPVGNVLRAPLGAILGSEAYIQQARRMIRRECPGCTCGIESSLAVRHPIAAGLFELSRLVGQKPPTTGPAAETRKAATPLRARG